MSHTCENILPYYKQYQINTLSLRPKLQDYALADFKPSVEPESDKTTFVKELRHYLSKANYHVKHLKKSLELRQRFQERHHMLDEDEGHKFARIKFATLAIDAEQKVRIWQSKLQELTFAERGASFLPQKSASFPYQDRNKPKVALKKKKSKPIAKVHIKRSNPCESSNDRLDYSVIEVTQKEKDSQEALLRKSVPLKVFDALWLWETLATDANNAVRDGNDEMLELFCTLGGDSSVDLMCEEICPCRHPDAFCNAVGAYVNLMLSRFSSRPKHIFTHELRSLFYCCDHLALTIFELVLSEITGWPVLDFLAFFETCFGTILGFVSFEWLWKQLHQVQKLSMEHPIAQLLKDIWRTYATKSYSRELGNLITAAYSGPCDLWVMNWVKCKRMNNILNNGLPLPIRNGNVEREYLIIHECVERKFNNRLTRARDILKRKNIKI